MIELSDPKNSKNGVQSLRRYDYILIDCILARFYWPEWYDAQDGVIIQCSVNTWRLKVSDGAPGRPASRVCFPNFPFVGVTDNVHGRTNRARTDE